MKTHALTGLAATAALPGFTAAWGFLGHTTVGYIATNLVRPATRSFFQDILHNTTEEYLAGVATWADSYRYTEAGRFSAAFHFIDAQDHPPAACGVTFDRDCPKQGCIVAAIQNYTGRIMDTSLDAGERTIAAKFIIHFLGDIHQPLHTEHLDIGGNRVAVNFSGVATNLHSVWDSAMPEKLVGGYALADAKRWAATLTEAITTGIYQSQTVTWLEGIDLADPVGSSLVWAGDANRFVCTTVMPLGADVLRGKELNGSYYTSAIPVIQLQIARGGFRLAKWLDLIADAMKPTSFRIQGRGN